MANTYKPFCVGIYTDAISQLYVPDILAMSTQDNPTMQTEMVAHDYTPRHVALTASTPMQTFSTFALPTILDNLGVIGATISTSTGTGITQYWRKYDANGEPASGSAHRSLVIKGGRIVPKSISCSHQGHATIQVETHPIKTSGAAIVVLSETVALPTVSIASARWTIGSIKLGNVALTGSISVEIDFGNALSSRGQGSDVFDTQIEQSTHSPTITLRGIDPTWFSSSNFGLTGKAVLHANDYIYFRQRSQDDTNFTANATTNHIKVAFNGLGAADQVMQADAQRISENDLRLVLARDSSGNAPIIITTGVAHV